VNGSAENDKDDPDNYVPSDMYFGGLDFIRPDEGDWDLNDNGIYGEDYFVGEKKIEEKDFHADVYVGRFPASTQEEMKIMVRKQLAYERAPPPGAWARSMLLSGSLMDAPNDPANYQSYKDNAYELVLKVEEELPEHVTPFKLVDYPQIEYGGYNIMFDTLNKSSFESYYEAGFSTVLIACHGDAYNGNCTNYKGESGGRKPYVLDYEDHFTYDMAGAIQNGERLPVVYISSCGSTPFQESDDTNMERLLTNPNGGAIALIGATVDTYRGEFRPDPDDPNSTYSFGNWWLAQEFYRLLYEETPRPGEALYKQKWNYRLHLLNDLGRIIDIAEYSKIFNIDTLAYNLMGDPEGPIWLDEPKEMSVMLPETFDHEEGITIPVVDRSTGWPIQGAKVTITNPNDPNLYLTGATGAQGTLKLKPQISSLGDLWVVITKDGYIPVEGSVEATSLWDVEIDPDIQFIPDPPIFGESFKIVIRVSNNGEKDIDNNDKLLTSWSWYDTEERLPMSNVTSILIGDTKLIEGEVRWRVGDLSAIKVWVSVVPSRLESDEENNYASREIILNQPLEMNLMDRIELDEDRKFSEKWGTRLDLIALNRIVDSDGPEPITVNGEVLRGKITLEQDETDQSFDIIPDIDWSGEAEIQFRATDGSKSKSGNVIVEVLEVPDQPRFEEYPSLFNCSEDVNSIFTVTLYDVDSMDLNLTTTSNWVIITTLQSGHTSIFEVNVTPTDQHLGQTPLTLVASDGITPFVNLTIFLKVNATNDPPKVVSPMMINITKGDDLEIDLDLHDPDGDTDFNITIYWDSILYYSETTNFIIPIDEFPPNTKPGEYHLTVIINDYHQNGITSHEMTVNIRERDTEDYSLVLIVLVVLIFSFLLIYGVFLRLQERKQKRMLDSVGTSAPIEARPLSEKDFKKRRRKGRKKDDGLPMPPAPLEVEGALAREEVELEEDAKYISSGGDLESDIDELLSEMFP
jgi:hypothetical protein